MAQIIIDNPLSDTSALLVIEVMCSLIGGTAPLNPQERPFCLHFFKNRKIEPYLMMVCSHLRVTIWFCNGLITVQDNHIGHLHASGNYRTRIDFLYEN